MSQLFIHTPLPSDLATPDYLGKDSATLTATGKPTAILHGVSLPADLDLTDSHTRNRVSELLSALSSSALVLAPLSLLPVPPSAPVQPSTAGYQQQVPTPLNHPQVRWLLSAQDMLSPAVSKTLTAYQGISLWLWEPENPEAFLDPQVLLSLSALLSSSPHTVSAVCATLPHLPSLSYGVSSTPLPGQWFSGWCSGSAPAQGRVSDVSFSSAFASPAKMKAKSVVSSEGSAVPVKQTPSSIIKFVLSKG